jgi:hypothetical protein
MKITSGFLYPAAIALLLGTGLTARASLVAWSYDFDRTPAVVLAGTGGVTLTNEPGATAAGSSDIVATNLKVFSSADASSPDHLSPTPYTLTLSLTDTASHASTTMTFHGMLSGTFSAGSAHILNSFTGATMLTAVLGGNTYAVNLGAYSPPGPPSASNSGSISAHVTVTPAGNHGGHGGPPPSTTPEPATAIMAGLGLGFVGLASWRKRRRARSLAAILA